MGMIRFLLALSVLQAHSDGDLFGLRLIGGRPAVVVFYIMSGFYMSLILNKKYLGAGSIRIFYLNRWLRLWPTYLISLGAAVLAFAATKTLGGLIENYERCSFGLMISMIFSNLFLFGQDMFWLFGVDSSNSLVFAPFTEDPRSNGNAFLLNPPSFTIAIEMAFYLLAPFVVRSTTRSIAFLCVGVGYHVALLFLKIDSVAWTYHFLPSAFVYFGMGAVIYHFYDKRLHLTKAWHYFVLIALCGAILKLRLLLPGFLLLAFTFAIPAMFNATRYIKVDRFIGELSYAIYILHFPVMRLLKPQVGPGELTNWVAMVVISISVLLYFYVERPINRWREKMATGNSRPLGSELTEPIPASTAP